MHQSLTKQWVKESTARAVCCKLAGGFRQVINNHNVSRRLNAFELRRTLGTLNQRWLVKITQFLSN